MDRPTILDDCLARLKAGASIADCLSLYPGQAAQLAPMLAAAVQLPASNGFCGHCGQPPMEAEIRRL